MTELSSWARRVTTWSGRRAQREAGQAHRAHAANPADDGGTGFPLYARAPARSPCRNFSQADIGNLIACCPSSMNGWLARALPLVRQKPESRSVHLAIAGVVAAMIAALITQFLLNLGISKSYVVAIALLSAALMAATVG